MGTVDRIARDGHEQSEGNMASSALAAIHLAIDDLATALALLDSGDMSTLVPLEKSLSTLRGLVPGAGKIEILSLVDAAQEKLSEMKSAPASKAHDAMSGVESCVSLLHSKLQNTSLVFAGALPPAETRDKQIAGAIRPSERHKETETDPNDLFLKELPQAIARLTEWLHQFESNGNRDALDNAQFEFHRIAGDAGVLGLDRTRKICHKAEMDIRGGRAVPMELHSAVAHIATLAGIGAEKQPCPKIESKAPAETHVDMATDPELAAEFALEANEHLDRADEWLVALETHPDNKEAIAGVFRAFHTIKGSSSFLELEAITRLAHEAETLLDQVRCGKVAFSDDAVDATFSALDVLREMVGQVRQAGSGRRQEFDAVRVAN